MNPREPLVSSVLKLSHIRLLVLTTRSGVVVPDRLKKKEETRGEVLLNVL